MIATKTPSVEEFLRSQRDDRCEFVLGERIEKPLPNKKHARLQKGIILALEAYGQRTGMGEAFPEWHHRFGPPDDVRIYIPDVVFVLAPRHLEQAPYADAASDIVIEIVSPSQSPSDWIDKVEFYLQNGVKSVWIVDPEPRRISIYAPGKRMRRFDASDTLEDDLLPGFQLSLRELFS